MWALLWICGILYDSYQTGFIRVASRLPHDCIYLPHYANPIIIIRFPLLFSLYGQFTGSSDRKYVGSSHGTGGAVEEGK